MAQKIVPFLTFDGEAEEAVKFYLSVFSKAKRGKVLRYGDAGPGPKGEILMVEFFLNGQKFVALNGPKFEFTPAISLLVNCESQKEIDTLWKKLLKGGKALACGWIQDKYGVAWQITPAGLPDMLRDKNAAKSARVMKAMMQMVKLDIKKLKRAYSQKS